MGKNTGTIAGLLLFLLGTSSAAIGFAQPSAAAPEGREFEFAARRHYFAGVFEGDRASFERGKALVRERLEADADDPEALSWHGSYTAAEGMMAHASGEQQRGRDLWEDGLEHMARAVELAPLDLGPRYVRGSMLVSVGLDSFTIGGEAERELILETGLADMEMAHAMTRPLWDGLGVHERGSTLSMLARGHAELGHPDLARHYAERCVAETPDTRYAGEAGEVLARLNAGEIGRGAQPGQAGQPGQPTAPPPMEALFGHVVEMLDESTLLEPEGIGRRFTAFASDLFDDGVDPDKALQVFENLAQAHGGQARAWLGAALILRSGRLFEAGRWQTAVPLWERGKQELTRGVEDSQGAAGARLARGWVYALVAQHEQDPRAAQNMRKHAEEDLNELLGSLGDDDHRDARAAVIAALARVAAERGDGALARDRRSEAIELAGSPRIRELIDGVLTPRGGGGG